MAAGEQDFAYKRGVVLGLTLAEVLLLLVFCLLLASGFILTRAESQLAAAGGGDPQHQQANAEQLMNKLQAIKPQTQTVEDFTRDLVRAYEAQKLNPDRLLDKQTQALIDSVKDNAAAILAAKPPGQSMDQYGAAIAKRMAAPPDTAPGDRNGKHDWPPLINLSEADGYYFALGQARLTPSFEEQLHRAVVPKILQIIRDYGVDTIEVVGNTDELPLVGRKSNLDTMLAPVLRGDRPSEDLQPDDNAGLGMSRAVAVVRSLLSDPRLAGYDIHPLSAGQLIGTDHKLAIGGGSGDVKERRRIEIRLRRSDHTERG